MRRVLAVAALALVPTFSDASVIQWTDWTDSDLTGASGTMGGVGVTFTGTLAFAQLANGVMVTGGPVNANAGTDYWVEGTPAPYTNNAVVDNRPPGFELLGFDAASSNTISFSSPVTNPIMAIVSMGQGGLSVSYAFNAPFTVLSEGQGFWGDGSYLHVGNTLVGNELHAAIQFQGTFSQIQWSSTQEHWHGITVGSPVPEPGTIGLIVTGLIGLGARRRARRS